MVRIGISVEGTTEERFIKQVLAPFGIDKIRQFCPGFNGWLQALEATTLIR